MKEAAAALGKRDLLRGVRAVRVRENGVEMCHVHTTVRVPVKLAKPLPGRWSVHLSWLFQPIPPIGEFELLRSSFGLNVAGLTKPALANDTSLVRYDVDNVRAGSTGSPLGRHINVWQPAPIEDHVHYPALDAREEAWGVDEVLDFFLSESLACDLEGLLE
jgi:hypothetical protein